MGFTLENAQEKYQGENFFAPLLGGRSLRYEGVVVWGGGVEEGEKERGGEGGEGDFSSCCIFPFASSSQDEVVAKWCSFLSVFEEGEMGGEGEEVKRMVKRLQKERNFFGGIGGEDVWEGFLVRAGVQEKEKQKKSSTEDSDVKR